MSGPARCWWRSSTPDGSRPVTLAGQPIEMTARHTGVCGLGRPRLGEHTDEILTAGVMSAGLEVAGLHVEIDDGIATLWLDRPAKRNAVTYDMWNGIAAHGGIYTWPMTRCACWSSAAWVTISAPAPTSRA